MKLPLSGKVKYYAAMDFLGSTFDMIGKVMVSYTVIRVHYRFWKEHRIDEEVFSAMQRERRIGLLGIALIILGYLLQVPSKL